MVGTKGFARVLLLAIVACFGLVVLAAATPIKPDLKKLLNQPPPRHFIPARAGWYGPESQPSANANFNPTLEAYGPAGTARSLRAALAAAFIPDPKAVVAIAVLILLMRILRIQNERRRTTKVIAMPPPVQQQKAA